MRDQLSAWKVPRNRLLPSLVDWNTGGWGLRVFRSRGRVVVVEVLQPVALDSLIFIGASTVV